MSSHDTDLHSAPYRIVWIAYRLERFMNLDCIGGYQFIALFYINKGMYLFIDLLKNS